MEMQETLRMCQFPTTSLDGIAAIRKKCAEMGWRVFKQIEIKSDVAYLIIVECTEEQEKEIDKIAVEFI